MNTYLNKRKIFGYLTTILPALLAFIQLYLLYEFSAIEANIFFIDVSLTLFLSGVLALNTGYVFILRTKELKYNQLYNEYLGVSLFRLATFLVIIIPAILLLSKGQSIYVIIFAFIKLLIEIITIYFRATDQIYRLFTVSFKVFVFDLLALSLCYYFKESFIIFYSFTNFVALLIIFPYKVLLKKISIVYKKKTIIKYFDKIKPLSLSSVRENLAGSGLIYFSSILLAPDELAILINGVKVYSVGIILIGVYSNFYIQDFIRKGRNIKDEYFLYFLLVIGYTVLQIILYQTHLFSDIAYLIPNFLLILFILGVFLQSRYFIFQSDMLIKNKYNNLYSFEIIYIICYIIIIYLRIILII